MREAGEIESEKSAAGVTSAIFATKRILTAGLRTAATGDAVGKFVDGGVTGDVSVR